MKKKLTKLEKKLLDALEDAHAHLQYVGYGDSWEREGWKKLDDKITEAIAATKK